MSQLNKPSYRFGTCSQCHDIKFIDTHDKTNTVCGDCRRRGPHPGKPHELMPTCLGCGGRQICTIAGCEYTETCSCTDYEV